MDNITNIWGWIGFSVFVVIALWIDTILVSKRQDTSPRATMRASVYWTCVWITCALIFNATLWVSLYFTSDLAYANQKALDFFAGYLIEKSLSVDNLFVFYMIFHQFRIPVQYQHRVLVYGIWSAIIMRLLIILVGTWLIGQFHWILYVLGAFLLFTGIKMMLFSEHEKDLKHGVVMLWLKRVLRITHELEGHRFFIRKNHLLYATPLFIALVFVEISDLIFAFDSIPAIFAITMDPFIVWTSNIFAILGLRALYFLLAGMVDKFHLLKYGIALVLIFVGTKMIIEPWLQISTLFSLGVIVGILVSFVLASVRFSVKKGSQ